MDSDMTVDGAIEHIAAVQQQMLEHAYRTARRDGHGIAYITPEIVHDGGTSLTIRLRVWPEPRAERESLLHFPSADAYQAWIERGCPQ